jgi:hypothetical protein
MNENLNNWKTALNNGLDAVLRPSDFLALPPSGQPSSERLETLLSALDSFRVQFSDQRPSYDAAQRLTGVIGWSGSLRESLVSRVVGIIDAMDAGIAECLDFGITHERLIRTADCKAGGLTKLTTARPNVTLFAIRPYFLSSEHPMRKLLPEAELYMYESQPHLVLGPAAALFGTPQPRRWYFVSDAKRWTAEKAITQQLKAEESARLYRLERINAGLPPCKPNENETVAVAII